jgi:biotin-(acetyl-CoA carboxylase) ligase
LNQIAGLTEKGGIKWVNDILLGGAKVAGVLAYTQSQGDAVTSAVLGLGINAETTPAVQPTPFVPEVACIQDFVLSGTTGIREKMFKHVLQTLADNYDRLLRDGFSSLLERYRARSVIVGREVTICADRRDGRVEVLAEGRVRSIGDNLELLLEGHPRPIREGRLVLGRLSDHPEDRESNPGTDLRATHGQKPIRFVT